MLKIKLARFGKRHQPHFRIVINEARDKRDGSYVAAIGRYVPAEQPKILEIDLEAYKDWMSKGAQPTDTVASLVKRYESGNPFPAKKPSLSKKAKAKLAAPAEEAAPVAAPAAEEPVAEEAAPEVTEAAPAEEVKSEEAPAETPAAE